MTYAGYIGAEFGAGKSHRDTERDYPQSFMMLDIAALQHMYGANFDTNAGFTRYSWSPETGEMYINGIGQGTPAHNVIFRTIWGGGGYDVYDMSNYSRDVEIDLSPGKWSKTCRHSPGDKETFQLAKLGDGEVAVGNIANARLYNGDTRSLIEAAYGGSGNDVIRGNIADNVLLGNAGNDSLYGEGGRDVLDGGRGNDFLSGGNGSDYLCGAQGHDTIWGGHGADLLVGWLGNDSLHGGFGDDHLYGGSESDTINGGSGNDTISGGAGQDVLTGGSGRDVFVFDDMYAQSLEFDFITDFNAREDKIAFYGLGNDGNFGAVKDTMAVFGHDEAMIFGIPGNSIIVIEGQYLDELAAHNFIF